MRAASRCFQLNTTDFTRGDVSLMVLTFRSIIVFLTCIRVPIFIAVLVLIYLHRRHTQKLAKEDAMDKTKSMDFGMEFGGGTRSKVKPAHLTDIEKSDSRSRRQVSLDLDVASPYLLPAVLHNSRDTLHTLSATGDDRYGRPMTAGSSQHRGPLLPGNTSQYTNNHDRDSSIYAHSLRPDDSPDGSQLSIHGGLLSGASPMPMSTPPPPRKASLPASSPRSLVPQINIPSPATRSPPSGLPSNQRTGLPLRAVSKGVEQQSTAKGLPSTLQTGPPSPKFDIQFDLADSSRPISNDQSEYGEGPQFRLSMASEQGEVDTTQRHAAGRKSLAPVAFEDRRLSVGFRPLPPEGTVDENAEERAMRIRSFYKEYFEDTSPAPPLPTQPKGPGRHEDHHGEYHDDSVAVYDQETGRFVIPGAKPFAEPPARRAMTPPPRMPPRFGGPPRGESASSGRFMPPAPRSFSSASGRAGPGAPPPRKPMAPPAPLHLLPTPSMFTDDAFASPIMFAPPSRIPSEGGPESPSLRGGVRPYSPSVSPHVPLASAFEELAVLPNPHSLRNSSTFTGLDFAPPRKFKNDDTMSDAGSIRSNKSGMSALQIQNIRNGAYRVSRIPQEVVPAKDAIGSNLKPTWDMRK